MAPPSRSGGSPAPGPARRVAALVRQLAPASPFSTSRAVAASSASGATPEQSEELGTLRLGPHVSLPVRAPHDSSRLPRADLLLDLADPSTLEKLEWLGKKWALRQDVFLLSSPGPYARRLALTFCALLQLPYEHVALHRDVGEGDLLQTRTLQAGGNLVYEDGPVVRAMKQGSVLILEGVEKAERNVLPVLNNILENREVNLADGTQLVPAERLASADPNAGGERFIGVHPDFRIIAVGVPVPPYTGHPLDPPFRSRFQVRWVEGSVPGLIRATEEMERHPASMELVRRWWEWSILLRLHTQAASGGEGAVLPPTQRLPLLPSTAVPLLSALIEHFPPAVAPRPIANEANAPDAQATAAGKAILPQLDAHTRALLGSAFPMLYTLDQDKSQLLADLLDKVGLAGGQTANGQEETVAGLLGYEVVGIERVASSTARITFKHPTSGHISSFEAPCGPLPLSPVPQVSDVPDALGLLYTPRLLSLLAVFLQLHALGRDIAVLPSALGAATAGSQASGGVTTAIRVFGACLGYEVESVWLWKDIGGRELLMRRATTPDGGTSWEPAPLLRSAFSGKLVHLAGVDVLGPTLGSLARLTQDREVELWSGGRASLTDTESKFNPTEQEVRALIGTGRTAPMHQSFRIIATAAAPQPAWLNEEASTLFAFVEGRAMNLPEERAVIQARTQCSESELDKLLEFASAYRALAADPNLHLQKSRRLGTRQLIRVAARLARYADADMHALIGRALLLEFLPKTVRSLVLDTMAQYGIYPAGTEGAFRYRPKESLADPVVHAERSVLEFPSTDKQSSRIEVPLYEPEKVDPQGLNQIPQIDHFYDNAEQSLLMRDMAIDLQIMGEHLLLMGNQGTGKNKVMDRTLQLLRRPREYIQLHRDTTVQQLLQQVSLENGQVRYLDSPLVRAITTGRVIVVDEADKASPAVVAVFKSLAEHGQMTLPDGRRVRPRTSAGASDDVLVHQDFRLVLLANRPGYPFLGSDFLNVVGEGLSCYAVNNPDLSSEVRLVKQAAPDVPGELVSKLVHAFDDLRRAFVEGLVTYPFSLRELLHLAKHLQTYPSDDLTGVLRNTLDFDLHRPDAMAYIVGVFRQRGLPVEGLDLATIREKSEDGKRAEELRVQFDPKKAGRSTELDKPKLGKEDPKNEPHVGGNTWRGGTGGRDTAGLGGRGGFERLYKGHKIHQISDELKRDVPDHIKKQAREMAADALAKKLAEEGMTHAESMAYRNYVLEMGPQIQHLRNVLDGLQANAEERIWVKRQQDGELDDTRITDGLTGERAIYKRRNEAPPEVGAPQMKPKRLRFIVDVSASIHMQFDGRLERSLKTAIMIMEAMERLERPERFAWDIVGHSGDSPIIPLVELGKAPKTDGERWKVVRNMVSHMQYTDSGDYTLKCLEMSIEEVKAYDADDYFVCALSDANLGRYGITSATLGRVLRADDKVKTSVLFISREGEAERVAKQLPGKAFVARETKDVPQIVSDVLTTMVG